MARTEHAITKIFKLDDPEASGAHFQHLVDLLAETLELNEPSKASLAKLLQLFALDREVWTDGRHAAYALATAYHETGYPLNGKLVRFAPVTEYGTRPYFNKYEPETKIGDRLGNTEPGDGYLFRGRGFVQITGRANYAKFSEIVGHDLIADPDKALDPATAYIILREGMMRGFFTGKALPRYISYGLCDYINARRVINGLDRAEQIARIARQIDQVLHS
jgi:putative chitinase